MTTQQRASSMARVTAHAAATNHAYLLVELSLTIQALVVMGGAVAHRHANDAVLVLLSQQRIDGSFGYLGHEPGTEAERAQMYLTLRATAALATYLEARADT